MSKSRNWFQSASLLHRHDDVGSDKHQRNEKIKSSERERKVSLASSCQKPQAELEKSFVAKLGNWNHKNVTLLRLLRVLCEECSSSLLSLDDRAVFVLSKTASPLIASKNVKTQSTFDSKEDNKRPSISTNRSNINIFFSWFVLVSFICAINSSERC